MGDIKMGDIKMGDIKKGDKIKLVATGSLRDFYLEHGYPDADGVYEVKNVENDGVFIKEYSWMILHSDYEKFIPEDTVTHSLTDNSKCDAFCQEIGNVLLDICQIKDKHKIYPNKICELGLEYAKFHKAATLGFDEHSHVDLMMLLANLRLPLISKETVRFIMSSSSEMFTSNFICTKPMTVKELLLSDTNSMSVKIMLYRNINLAERRGSNLVLNESKSLSFAISDFACYSKNFIEIVSVEKLHPNTDISVMSRWFDTLNETFPIVLEAGYLYGAVYDRIESEKWACDLVEHLEEKYEKLGFVNINDVVGQGEDYTFMCRFPVKMETDSILHTLKYYCFPKDRESLPMDLFD